MHEQSVIMNHLSCMPRCHAKLPTLHEVPVYLTPLLYQVLIVFKRVCALIGLHGKPGALLHTHTHTCKNNPFTTPHFTFHLTGLVCVCVWRLALFPGYSHCPVFGYQNWLPKKKNWTVGRPGNKFGYWLIDCSCFYQPYRQHQPDCFTCMRQSSLFPSHPSTTEVAWYWINTSHHSFFAYHKLDGGKSWELARLITMDFSNSIGSLLPPSTNQ